MVLLGVLLSLVPPLSTRDKGHEKCVLLFGENPHYMYIHQLDDEGQVRWLENTPSAPKNLTKGSIFFFFWGGGVI